MEVVIVPDESAVARLVADAVERLVTTKRDAVLGLATGSSPLPTYVELIARCAADRLSFRCVRAFLLDEYLGLPGDHPESYRAVIRRHLTDQLDIPADHVHGPDGTDPDPAAACERYESAIRTAGGIDLQLLGIGTDGHVGFNEPTSSLGSRTRVKTLTAETRRDNARFFGDPGLVPSHVLTQGIGTILDARHLVLIACGASKAAAVVRAIEGPVAAVCPASALQLHPHATFVLDDAAASQLKLAEYYRSTWAGKPPWQAL